MREREKKDRERDRQTDRQTDTEKDRERMISLEKLGFCLSLSTKEVVTSDF